MASFAAETITYIGTFPITNTVLHTLIVDALLISGTIFATKNLKKIPYGFQNLVEFIISSMYSLTQPIASHNTKRIFPYFMSFFLFIFIANISALLPGFGSIGFFKEKPDTVHAKTSPQPENSHSKLENNNHPQTLKENKTTPEKEEGGHGNFTPLLRGATSDINLTFALAIISVIATHMLSIQITGFKDYITRYISFNPINLYVGLLEIIAELTKIVSLSFRLFGNIFAGEVALSTVSNIFAFLFPLPFLLLESIVAVVQALVFSMLTLVFMSILTTPHHAHEAQTHD